MPASVAISMGDPLGVGPEVVALALADPRVRAAVDATVYGSRVQLEKAAALRKVPLPARVVETGHEERPGACALAALERATRAVLGREHRALCTAPLSKERVARELPGFVGHTEYLAAQAGSRVAMMMAGPRLRVVLATNHLRLADVPSRLTPDGLAFILALTHRELRSRFGLDAPRIAVCGLNPHAGDGGLFGDEEERLIAPAIRAAAREGARAEGPFAADGLFPKAARGAFDAVVALYHDQGLIPAKLLDFRETVNVTLGLPFARTSPDHGTADDIAWQGRADAEPMISALLLAARLSG